MLVQLQIQNFILIEKATVNLEKGFNVISGETGSGKSAILSAIQFICGSKSDQKLIRHGENKGSVHALFDISNKKEIQELLKEHDIEFYEDEFLILQREIANNGKTRAWINHHPVTVSVLKNIGSKLILLCSQHANYILKDFSYHQEIVDLFADNNLILKDLKRLWDQHIELQRKIKQLIDKESQKIRDLDIYSMELEEIRSANLIRGEEDELFEEYTSLVNIEEKKQLGSEITHILENGIILQLKRVKSALEKLATLEKSLNEDKDSFNLAFIEMQEVFYALQRFVPSIENNPLRMEEIDKRLKLITKMKKKYGNSYDAIFSYAKNLEINIHSLEHFDEELQEKQKLLLDLQTTIEEHCQRLTQKREKAAAKLTEKITLALQQLNMKGSRFEVLLKQKPRDQLGDEQIEFYLAPNVGEKKVLLNECASGGELARIMLSIQSLLSDKEHVCTAIYDEIDSNIGGETASIIGSILKNMGQKQQIICITHFPQVAKQADFHFQIAKEVHNGRTTSQIKILESEQRQEELLRMMGGLVNAI